MWFKFNEDPQVAGLCGPTAALGETFCDSSGYNNHGRPHNGIWWYPGPSPVQFGGAIGVQQGWISVENFNLDISTGFTFSCKIYSELHENEADLFEKKNNNDTQILIGFSPNNFAKTTVKSGNQIITAEWDANAHGGENFFITGAFGNGQVRSYYNGQMMASQNIDQLPLWGNSEIIIGKNTSLNSYFFGGVDECILINKDLGDQVGNNIAVH